MAHPLRLIIAGFLMALIGGVVMPFLMVVKIVDVTRIKEAFAWILIFGSYAVSVAGLFMGIIGFASFARLKKAKKEYENRQQPGEK